MKDLEGVFDWIQISCPQFEGILYYHPEKDLYRFKEKIIHKSDNRLIKYLEMIKQMKPI